MAPIEVTLISIFGIWSAERCFKYVMYRNRPVVVCKHPNLHESTHQNISSSTHD